MAIFFKKRALKKAVREALADNRLTDTEALELAALRDELGVDGKVIDDLRRQHFQSAVDPILARINTLRRFTPDDEQELTRLSKDLQIGLQYGDEFRLFRALWEIEKAGTFEPKEIETDLRLTKNEVCYHECPSVWRQEKTVRENTGYVGGSIGFRVAKGVTLRMGRAVPTYRTYDEIRDISAGDLYFTNKKIVFVGDKRSTNITFGRLARYELYQDAVKIHKTSGQPDIFSLSRIDVEYLDALFQVVG